MLGYAEEAFAKDGLRKLYPVDFSPNASVTQDLRPRDVDASVNHTVHRERRMPAKFCWHHMHRRPSHLHAMTIYECAALRASNAVPTVHAKADEVTDGQRLLIFFMSELEGQRID